MNNYLAAYTINNSKWIQDFNARIEIIKFLKQNIVVISLTFSFGNDILI